MTRCLLSVLLIIGNISMVSAQGQIGWFDELYQFHSQPISLESTQNRGNTFQQLEGFPQAFEGNRLFKNFRNVTIEDINQDGLKEILFVADATLYAINTNGILWQAALNGTATYPPSTADMDGDGDIEIVQAVFGGQTGDGNISVFDHNGLPLSGWPITFKSSYIIAAPALSDMDGDGIMEIVFTDRSRSASVGNIHIYKLDGTTMNGWPARLDTSPAVTPSIGDMDNDGSKEVVVFSTASRYIFQDNGTTVSGWPISNAPTHRFSYHSPVLIDLDGQGNLSIVGSTIGDAPEFFIQNMDGSYRNGWPQRVPDNVWSYTPPTVIALETGYQIFMGRQTSNVPTDMLYGWDKDGLLMEAYPIIKAGGLNGIISVADVDNDNQQELIFGSNLLGEDGHGFIHAFEMNGSGAVEGFPIYPKGWTLMNGIAIDDIDNNGTMDLVALSYTNSNGSMIDSVYINAYDLEIPYDRRKVLWDTYKGSNTRDGWIGQPQTISSIPTISPTQLSFKLFPNPTTHQVELSFTIQEKGHYRLSIWNSLGQKIATIVEKTLNNGQHNYTFTPPNEGLFWVRLENNTQQCSLPIMVIK